jgi:serine/threonine protein kinase
METLENKTYSQYKVTSKLGVGGFAVVYKATHLVTAQEVALKVGKLDGVSSQEVSVMETLQKYPGFPKVYESSTIKGHRYIAMELLGHSTNDYFKLSAGRFDRATVIGIVTQGISHLETMHRAGFLHRDIKPEHLLYKLGATPRSDSPIYLTDFGLVRQLSYSLNLMSGAKVSHIVGNARFVGVNAHMNSSHSKADDLESMVYIALYFLKGWLPWDALMKVRGDQWMKIKSSKEEFINRKCPECPPVFSELLRYLQRLRFTERPDYNFIRLKIKELEVVEPCPIEIPQVKGRDRLQRRKTSSPKRKRKQTSSTNSPKKSRAADQTFSFILCSPEDEGELTERYTVGPSLRPEARWKISDYRAMMDGLQRKVLSATAFSPIRNASS